MVHPDLFFAHANPTHSTSSRVSFTSSIWTPTKCNQFNTKIISSRLRQSRVIVSVLWLHFKVKLSKSVHVDQHVLHTLTQYQVFRLSNLVDELDILRMFFSLEIKLPSLCLWVTYLWVLGFNLLMGIIISKLFCLCLNEVAHEKYLAYSKCSTKTH